MSTKTCDACGRDSERGGLVCPHCATPYRPRESPWKERWHEADRLVRKYGYLWITLVGMTIWLVYRPDWTGERAAAERAANDAALRASKQRQAQEALEAAAESTRIDAALTRQAEAGRVIIGMSGDHVLRAWGDPSHKNTTETARGRTAQWAYPNRSSYVYLVNDRVTAIQTSR